MEHRWKRLEGFDKLATRGYRPDDLNDYFDLGLPPHPTDVGTIPFSVQAVAELAASPAEEVEEEPRGGGAPGRETGSRALDLVDEIARLAAREIPKKWKGLRKAFDAYLKPREKQAARKFSRFYIEQRGRVLKRLNNGRADDDPITGKYADMDDALKAVFPRDEEDASLIARLAPLWSEHLKDGWEFFFEHESAGADLKDHPFQVDDPRAQAAIDRRKIQGTKINETTEEDLREIFRQGFEEGDTTAQLADRVDAYYKAHCTGETKHRPVTAAQTQTTGIVNDGRLLAAREVGGLKKGWLHGGSKEPRPEHLAAQSTYLENPIGLDEKFTVNGIEMDAPGDAAAPVSETAKCTCMVTLVAAN